MSELRNQWLQQAEEHYAEYSRTKPQNEKLRFEIGLSLLRLGDAQRLQQKTEEANASYKKASQIFAALSKSSRNNSALLQSANAQMGLAMTTDPNDRESALSLLEKAIATAEELVRIDRDNSEFIFARSRFLIAKSRLIKNDKPTISLRMVKNAMDDLEYLSTKLDESKIFALLNSARIERAQLAMECGKARVAQECLQDAIRSFDELLQKSQRPDYAEGRMTCRILLGNSYQSSENPVEAKRCFEQALQDFHEVLKILYRGEFHSQSLAQAQVHLADILMAENDWQTASAHLTDAIQEFVDLIRLHGQQPNLLFDFADATQKLAITLTKKTDLETAEAESLRALEIWDHLISEKMATGPEPRCRTECYLLLANIHQLRGETPEAKNWIRKAIASAESKMLSEIRSKLREFNIETDQLLNEVMPSHE